MLAGIALYAFPASFLQIVVAAAILGLGFGLVNPGLIAAASLRTSSDNQGAVAGLMQAMMASGYVIGPLAGTALYEVSPFVSALMVAGVFGLAFLVVLPIGFKTTEPEQDVGAR
ncbi:MAG: MFS transporter [Henriciella sp.]|jgi:MFS family permease